MSIPKSYTQFEETLMRQSPPTNWSGALRAMWFDVKGDWEASHNIAQDMHDDNGSWIHAYLHRKEGDEFNAGYWYRRAGKTFSNKNLEEEQRELVEYFLAQK